jgi:hypothetical protein
MLTEYDPITQSEESEDWVLHSITKDIKPLLPEFETLKEAEERQMKMLLALEEENLAATTVTHLLRWCQGGGCMLSMCPACVWRLRICFILGARSCADQVRSVLNQGRELPVVTFSAVLNKGRYPVNQLHQMDLPSVKRRVQRKHQGARFPLAFAGINISFNETSFPKNPPFWQAQVEGVVVGLEVDAVKAALDRQYPHAASVPRALEWSELPQVLSSVIHPTFVRQVTHIDNTGRQTTDNYDLDAPQLRELALALGRFKLPERYALTGCRRRSSLFFFEESRWWIEPDLGILGRIKVAESARSANSN